MFDNIMIFILILFFIKLDEIKIKNISIKINAIIPRDEFDPSPSGNFE